MLSVHVQVQHRKCNHSGMHQRNCTTLVESFIGNELSRTGKSPSMFLCCEVMSFCKLLCLEINLRCNWNEPKHVTEAKKGLKQTLLFYPLTEVTSV